MTHVLAGCSDGIGLHARSCSPALTAAIALSASAGMLSYDAALMDRIEGGRARS